MRTFMNNFKNNFIIFIAYRKLLLNKICKQLLMVSYDNIQRRKIAVECYDKTTEQ